MATIAHAERRHIPDRRATGHSYDSARMSALEWVPLLLTIVGGLNWGLVGLFDFNLVAAIFGESSAITRLIYVVVGLSALYSLYVGAKASRKHA